MATIQDLASRLLSDLGAPQTPQMQHAAEAWIVNENGVNNNILGVTSNGHLNQYANPYAGIDAAAALLKTGNHGYSKVVTQARAGNPTGFLYAVEQSGWNAPTFYGYNPSLGRQGRLISTYNGIQAGTYRLPHLNSPGGTSAAPPPPTGGTTSTPPTGTLTSAGGINVPGVSIQFPDIQGIAIFMAVVAVGLTLLLGGFLLSKPGQSAAKTTINLAGTAAAKG